MSDLWAVMLSDGTPSTVEAPDYATAGRVATERYPGAVVVSYLQRDDRADSRASEEVRLYRAVRGLPTGREGRDRSVKDDELTFLKVMAVEPQETMADEVMERLGLNRKRGYYLLSKWTRKGWWEYGVSIRTGWFDPEGVATLRECGIEVTRSPFIET